MKIGIISKKSHAKAHASALRKKGHQVILLGGNPKQVPPSLDVLVCRPDSVAHGGFATTMGQKKAGMKVVLANGMTEILEAVAAMNPNNNLEPTDMNDITNSADAMRVLSRLLGAYGPLLHESKAGPVVEQLARARGKDGALGLTLWKKALKVCKRESVRNWGREQAAKNDPLARWVYTYPPRGGVRKVCIFVTDPAALDVVLSRMDAASTEQEALNRRTKKGRAAAQREQAKKSLLDMLPGGTARPVVPAPPPGKIPPPPPPPPLLAALASGGGPAGPTPRPRSRSQEAAQSRGQEAAQWDDSLREAIALVLAEMRAVQVQSLTIQGDGSVGFHRVVVTEGSMQVVPDEVA